MNWGLVRLKRYVFVSDNENLTCMKPLVEEIEAALLMRCLD